MLSKPLLDTILHNEALTRGLSDPEARILVEWLVDRAEIRGDEAPEKCMPMEVQCLCRRGRAIARFVTLWCYEGEPGAAAQLAGAQQFHWQLPTSAEVDPCELMQHILTAEAKADE